VKLVIKIGGAALDSKELVQKFAKTIPSLCKEGHQIVIVHGGGAALSRTLKQLGCETTFIDGLRVTNAQTRDVAIMVLAGQLNKQLVAVLGAAGQPAVGLCGGDLGMFRASKKQSPDLGFVGEIRSVNQMASACAIACGAHALIYLTDVPGVKDAEGTVIRWLDVRAIAQMVQKATVSGGMLPKLEACTSALKKGVTRVRILPADHAEVLPGFFTHAIDCGTEVIAS
jgi:acetylglutamate kinase